MWETVSECQAKYLRALVYLASLLGDDFEEDAAAHDDDNPFGEEEDVNGLQDSFEPGMLGRDERWLCFFDRLVLPDWRPDEGAAA